jgi:hypothetical protein
MKFLCLIFFDERVLDDLSKRQYDALVDESLAYDERLREGNHFIAAQALQSAKEAVTLRVRGDMSRSPTAHSPRPRSRWVAFF